MTEPTQPGGRPLNPRGRPHPFRPRRRGVIGKQHSQVAAELADRIELVAVVDPHADRAERLAAEHGAATFASLTEALAAVETDAEHLHAHRDARDPGHRGCAPAGT